MEAKVTWTSTQLQGTDGIGACPALLSSRSCDIGASPEGECQVSDVGKDPEGECRVGEKGREPAQLGSSPNPSPQLGTSGTLGCEEAVTPGTSNSDTQASYGVSPETNCDSLLQCVRNADGDVHSSAKRAVSNTLCRLFEEADRDAKSVNRCAVLSDAVKVLLAPIDAVAGDVDEQPRLAELKISLRLELICAFRSEWETEHSCLLDGVLDSLDSLQFALEEDTILDYADRVVKKRYNWTAPEVVERIYRQAELLGYNDESEASPDANEARVIEDAETPIHARRSEETSNLKGSRRAWASPQSNLGHPWAPRARKEIFASPSSGKVESALTAAGDLLKEQLCAKRREQAKRLSHFANTRALSKLIKVPLKQTNGQTSVQKRMRKGAEKSLAAPPKSSPPLPSFVAETPMSSSVRVRPSIVFETPVRTVSSSTPSASHRLWTGSGSPDQSLMATPKTATTEFQTVLATPNARSWNAPSYAASSMAGTSKVLETPVRTVVSLTSLALLKASAACPAPSVLVTPASTAASPIQTVVATPGAESKSATRPFHKAVTATPRAVSRRVAMFFRTVTATARTDKKSAQFVMDTPRGVPMGTASASLAAEGNTSVTGTPMDTSSKSTMCPTTTSKQDTVGTPALEHAALMKRNSLEPPVAEEQREQPMTTQSPALRNNNSVTGWSTLEPGDVPTTKKAPKNRLVYPLEENQGGKETVANLSAAEATGPVEGFRRQSDVVYKNHAQNLVKKTPRVKPAVHSKQQRSVRSRVPRRSRMSSVV